MKINIKMQYEEYGEGTPIIMLHGFSADRIMLKSCMEPIFKDKNGFRRIYLDLPGMGKTPSDKWIDSTDKMLKIVMSFINSLIPNQKFLIVGESYGAYLARGIINKKMDAVDGLLMICPVIVATHSKRDTDEKVVLYKDEEFLSSLTEEERENFESMHVVLNKENWERYNKEIYQSVKCADSSFLRYLMVKGYDFSFDVDKLEKPYEKPTAFIMGRQDSVVGYRDAFQILNNYPRASFTILDRAGHNVQIEQEKLFNEVVTEWIDRVNNNY